MWITLIFIKYNSAFTRDIYEKKYFFFNNALFFVENLTHANWDKFFEVFNVDISLSSQRNLCKSL